MKVDRLLAIIMLLLNKEKVTANELADYFEVSVRTIHRDMEAINAAGIPIVSYQGKSGGFSIMENYKVDKNFLTNDEVSSLMLALKGVSNAYDDKNINNIVEKVKVLREDKGVYGKEKLVVDFTPWGSSEYQKAKVRLIKEALEDNKLLSFQYTNLNGMSSERLVEPYSLVLKVASWYVYGYCREKRGSRLFKVSRMRDLKKEEENFLPRDEKLDKFPWESDWNDGRINEHIVMKFTPRSLARIEDYFEMEQVEFLGDGSLKIEVDYPEDEWVYGMILSFGNDVEVLEPLHIREIIKKRAQRIYEQYK